VGRDSQERSYEGEKGGLYVEGRVRPLFFFFGKGQVSCLGQGEEKVLDQGATAWCERDRLQVSFFFFFTLKITPFLCVSCGPIFIGKMFLNPQI